ncbi:MAG: hypothetical protein IJW82_04885 [Clostridia bacterium]|nr:hypothetical protein [Clostridia bacterium]
MKSIITEKNSQLEYNGYNLVDMAQKYGSPLKILFLDVIKKQISTLKNALDNAILKNDYQGKFIYSTANKASYCAESVMTSSIHSDAVEVSSYNDLCLTEKIYEIANISKNKMIICNGIKEKHYRDKIIELSQKGYNMLDIIDSVDEYDYLEENAKTKINIGLRANLKSIYGHAESDRFGLTKEDFKVLETKIPNAKNLVCTTIHYHQRGFDYEDDKFYQNLAIALDDYFIPFSKKIKTITNMNLGGGTPLPLLKDFDYNTWADKLIKYFKSKELNCNIIFENGKYTFKDSLVNIYEIIQRKDTNKEFTWYVINGSLLIAMAEKYAVGEDLLVTPINLLNNPKVKAKLAGVTCDCDDTFYDHDLDGLMLPQIKDGEKLYIGILGTGSYQEAMNGRNGVHHCLLPEEKRVVVYTKDGQTFEEVTNDLQSPQDIMNILKCNKEHLEKFM